MTNEKLVELLREARRLIHTALSIDALQHWACESDDDEVALDDEMRALRTNIDAALAEADDDGESAHRKFMTALAAMNKDQQRQTLVNAGILTEGGAVAEPYKDVLAEQQGPTKEVVASDEVTWAWVSPSEYRAIVGAAKVGVWKQYDKELWAWEMRHRAKPYQCGEVKTEAEAKEAALQAAKGLR